MHTWVFLVSHKKRSVSCTALSDFALRAGLLRLWRGCESATRTAKSLVKATATDLTASVGRTAATASCQPMRKGT
jgi:hypothetical protein